ncbi:MAG TPA: hypothetical protein VIY53_17590 [Acidobacteriaceae bacterium]
MPLTSSPSRISSRLLITGVLAILSACASVWLMRSSAAIACDALAPLTVLATLSAFLISVCFRLMGRFPDRRSRWFLLVCLLIAAATLFSDFRYVRRYRGFCGNLRQQMHQTAPR